MLKLNNFSNMRTILTSARAWRGVAALLLFVVSAAANAYDFEAVNGDGATIYYNIVSSSERTCEVTYGGTSTSSRLYSGSVNIPEAVTYNETTYSVTGIGRYAFYYCGSITAVTIPNSVTTIGYDSFSNCTSLKRVDIPNGVTTIDGYAFYKCTSLTSVTIGEGVTTIGGSAFEGCTGLTGTLTIPNSVTSIGSEAFAQCTKLTEFDVAEGNEYYCSVDGVLFTKDMTELLQFPASSSLEYYDIPYGVESIDNYAFYKCSNLTQISIPNSVTSIGYSAFENCTGLTGELVIPEGVTTIASGAFYNCSGLTGELVIPEGVTTIASGAFYGCSGLTNVTIPNSVTSIGSDAFYGCSGLTNLTIPNSVKTIGDQAFVNCTGLTGTLTIPNSVTSIGSHAFYGCSGLTSLTIGNNVTTIYSSAFYGCTGLTEVTIPSSVTGISSAAFSGCTGLTKFEVAEDNKNYCSVDGVLYSKDMKELVQFPLASPLLPSFDIPNSVTEIGSYAFSGCSGLTEITIPNSVTEIGIRAFDSCTGLTEVAIPESVTEIGSYAFGSCSGLTSLTLGNSVTTIGNYAFAYCTGLTSITSLNPEPPTCSGNFVFYLVDTGTCVLYVPARSTSSYSTADIWKNFKNIVGVDLYSPTVQTLRATEVTFSTATLNGTVTAGEDEILEQGFEYWCTDGDVVTVKCTGGEMSVTITGLESGATYTYRAYAKTESGTTYGSKVEFTTIMAPTVETYEATDVTYNSATLNGYVEAGEEEILECGFEYWTTAYDVQTITSTGGNLSIAVANLMSSSSYDSVTYTYRAYAKTESGTTYGEEMTFTTEILWQPDFITHSAMDVTSSSATLQGSASANTEEILEQGFVFRTESGEEYTIEVEGEVMSVTITGLEPSTTYYYCVYARTESKTWYGGWIQFTTLAIVAPTVQTFSVTNVTSTSATLHGSVTEGEESIQEQGFEYWGPDGNVETITASGSDMSVTLTGLEDGVTYTYRAYARTESGTTYGEEMTFKAVTAPTVQTFAVTDVTESSAVLKGQVTAGSEDVLGQGFEYWAEGGEIQTIAMAKQTMEITLAGLEHGTTYIYRAYAITVSATTYGVEVSFTTQYDMDGVYAELEEAIEEMYDDFKSAWTTIITDYPDAEDDCMDYYDAIFDKVMDLTDLLDTSYRKGNLYDDVVSEIWSGIAEGERMIEEMLEAAKKVHETGIEDILANCGDDVRVYDLAGRRVHKFERGNVYIILYSDGTAKKVLVK